MTGRSVIDEKHFIYTTLKYAQTPQVSTKERIAPVVRINQLLPNYPNLFNSSTKFKYIVYRNCQVTLKLFDLTGQEIATLVDGQQLAGEHVINWNAGNLPSGVYVYHLQTKEFAEAKKLILIR